MEEVYKPISISVNQGQLVFLEGESSEGYFYIVKKGRIKLFDSINLSLIKEELMIGDFIGLVESLINRNRLTSAIAVENSELLKIHIDYLSIYVSINPDIIIKIINYLMAFNKLFNDEVNNDNDGIFFLANQYLQSEKFDKAFYLYSKYLQYNNSGKYSEQAKKIIKKLGNSYLWVLNSQNKNRDTLIKTYKKDTFLFSEGENSNEFFIIESGKVKITKVIDSIEIMVMILDKGSIIGEMSLLNKEPRNANAIAVENTTCIVINENNFSQVFSINPKIAMAILSKYSLYLWKKYRKLENKEIPSIELKIYDILLYELQLKNIGPQIKEYVFDISLMELLSESGLGSTQEGKKQLVKILNKECFTINNNLLVVDDVNIINILVKKLKTINSKAKVNIGNGESIINKLA